MSFVLCKRTEWEAEIRRRAASSYGLERLVGFGLLALLLLGAILATLPQPANDSIAVFGQEVPSEVIGVVRLAAGLLEVLLGVDLVRGIKDRLAPTSTRYRASAFAIIAELEAGHYVVGGHEYETSSETAAALRTLAYDLPVQIDNREEAERRLEDIAYRLAERMRVSHEQPDTADDGGRVSPQSPAAAG